MRWRTISRTKLRWQRAGCTKVAVRYGHGFLTKSLSPSLPPSLPLSLSLFLSLSLSAQSWHGPSLCDQRQPDKIPDKFLGNPAAHQRL